MRLINTETLELSEFFGSNIPAYAILSHTWTKEEVTLREWANPSDTTTSKAGYKKTCMACGLARRDDHAWIWVDTNCINKTSSAELSEAINSMFEWYSNANVCYVYLEDVTEDSLAEAGSSDSIKAQFCASRWFTRGWTLQELIAPSSLVFYNREWARLGTMHDFILKISETTGIDNCYLLDRGHLDHSGFLDSCIATRMSWVSRRQTTRVEDMAYCMLGFFDINMPLLYGEGPKAFIRLQEEIIRRHNDHTIFAWGDGFRVAAGRHRRDTNLQIGLLAPSPQAFANTRPFRPTIVIDHIACHADRIWLPCHSQHKWPQR
ncbi:heterokaryon incompatibility protein-domain-containing protein [Cercophora newfieldiana]|uniref:Heterokaryon incompatibility protein-domain-containing protein n=1 Tax=Cercophora newfieldiana TaxID=92897 RepID=A0AA39Y4Z1_9PEZI|nr:heterokaryon incompatibility protein-domain-containing protein [Cercophora newfieldiana]